MLAWGHGALLPWSHGGIGSRGKRMRQGVSCNGLRRAWGHGVMISWPHAPMAPSPHGRMGAICSKVAFFRLPGLGPWGT